MEVSISKFDNVNIWVFIIQYFKFEFWLIVFKKLSELKCDGFFLSVTNVSQMMSSVYVMLSMSPKMDDKISVLTSSFVLRNPSSGLGTMDSFSCWNCDQREKTCHIVKKRLVCNCCPLFKWHDFLKVPYGANFNHHESLGVSNWYLLPLTLETLGLECCLVKKSFLSIILIYTEN